MYHGLFYSILIGGFMMFIPNFYGSIINIINLYLYAWAGGSFNKDNAFVCCVHHSQMPVTSEEKDPRNYQGMPPCMMANIIPAGKPSHIVAPLNIFDNDNNY